MSFDAVAPWYRALETLAFGGALQRCRVACLGELGTPRHALIVGEGNGRFLCELLRAHPDLQVDCVDASKRMLQLALERVANDRVCFLHRDITNGAPPESHYDLVVTHFVLDCFPKAELSGVVKNLARSAKPDAVWLLGDFHIPAGGWSRLHARIWLAVMYRFFRLTARIRASELIDPTPYVHRGILAGAAASLAKWNAEIGVMAPEFVARLSCLSSRAAQTTRDLAVALELTQVACESCSPRRSPWIAKADLRVFACACEVPRRLRGSG